MTRGESPARGVLVRSRPIRTEGGRVIATLLIREFPDGTRSESVEPLAVPAPTRPRDWERPRDDPKQPPAETPADRVWRDR